MPTTTANGIQLYYERTGTGSDLVLISGHGNTHASWEHQLPVYSEHFQCLSFDNRGVGKSAVTSRGYTIEDMAADTLGLMDELGIAVAHVAGTSMGGSIAMAMALRAPERVRSLCLHATLGRPYPHIKLRYSMLIRATLVGDPHLWAEVTTYSAFAESYVNKNPEVIEQEIERRTQRRTSMSDSEVEGIVGQYLAFSSYDPFERLCNIRAPTLITVGSNDQVTPPRYAEDLKSKIPGSQLFVFPGAPHRAAVFAKDEFNQTSIDFLRCQEMARSR